MTSKSGENYFLQNQENDMPVRNSRVQCYIRPSDKIHVRNEVGSMREMG